MKGWLTLGGVIALLMGCFYIGPMWGLFFKEGEGESEAGTAREDAGQSLRELRKREGPRVIER